MMAPAVVVHWIRSSTLNFFVNYSTVKEIEIRNTYIALLHRTLQFVILSYIAIHIIWIQKGYQELQEARGASVIKVKGVARVSSGDLNFHTGNTHSTLWDTAEYGIPPIEDNAFFIVTRKTITDKQKQGTCPSALTNKLFCNSTYNPCKQGMPTSNAFGFLTGNCVSSQQNRMTTVCEINAWCPEELSNSTDYQINIDDLQNFTVFIKTIVSFTQFKIKVRTIKSDTDFSCRFNIDTHPRCPIFSIGYILQKLQYQDLRINMTALYYQGGLIEIQQHWKCNFDVFKEREQCFPTYTFHLLQSGNDKLSPGINYRFANKYFMNGIEQRTLTKIYGLRFILTISGNGGQFNVVNLFIAIGSGISYMIIAELVCEFIFMRFHKNRESYRQSKVNMCRLNEYKKNNSEKTISNHHRSTSPLFSSNMIYESEV